MAYSKSLDKAVRRFNQGCSDFKQAIVAWQNDCIKDSEPFSSKENESILDAVTPQLPPLYLPNNREDFPTPRLEVDLNKITLNEPYTNINIYNNYYAAQIRLPEGESTPIRLGVLLDKIYTRLWKREETRHPLPPYYAPQWKEITGELAIDFDGHKSTFRHDDIMRRFQDNGALDWLLNLGILRIKSRPELLCFATQLTQLYFAADFLRTLIDLGCEEEILAKISSTTNDFRNSLKQILRDLSPIDLKPFFKEEKNEPNSITK